MTGYDPQLLTTFLAVEQTGSFTRAATRLGIQQPTVSQHIRRLEQRVGRVLVLRDTHSVALTADGEAMAGFARNILAASDQASPTTSLSPACPRYFATSGETIRWSTSS
jgi:DNA-binding transcriptional LysR family regulator